MNQTAHIFFRAERRQNSSNLKLSVDVRRNPAEDGAQEVEKLVELVVAEDVEVHG